MAAKLRPHVNLPRHVSSTASRTAEARGRQLQPLVGPRLPLSTQLYAASAAMLGVERATEVIVASGAAPVSAVEDHPADDDGNERDRAEDRSGEPEVGGAIFDEWKRRHHSKEKHKHDELLPQPHGVGILECGSLLVGVLHGLPFARPNAPVQRRAAERTVNCNRFSPLRSLITRSHTSRSGSLLTSGSNPNCKYNEIAANRSVCV